jgi:hypothetical protein
MNTGAHKPMKAVANCAALWILLCLALVLGAAALEADASADFTLATGIDPNWSDAFRVHSTAEPTASVALGPFTSGPVEVEIPGAVSFHSGDRNGGMDVIVSVADDKVVDGKHIRAVWAHAGSGNDSLYEYIDLGDVTIAEQDDDQAGIRVAPTNLTISEPNGIAVFTVTLTSQPLALVVLPLGTSNDECMVSHQLLTWSDNTWENIAIVIVSARDDDVADGDQACVVETGPAYSSDPSYDGLDPVDIVVAVRDNEAVWWVYQPLVLRTRSLIPNTPTLNPISNPEDDGTYSVNWTSVAEAEAYILEEATDSTFSAAVEVYTGLDTSYDISGRGAARYYYRVRAHNRWGSSPWSEPAWVDVLWEAEPNDDPLVAANGPLVSGLFYNGTFANEADVNDYFYFDLPTTRRVELWLTNIPLGHNYDLVLRDVSLNLVGYSGNLSNANEHILIDSSPAGRYYIQVYHRSAGGSIQPYKLRLVYPQ